MARTRTGRGAPESPGNDVQDPRSVRLTRRRAGGANMTERVESTETTTVSASATSRPTTRGRGRDKVAPTSTTLREMAEEREEREEDVEKREEEDLYRNEPVARFNAKEIVRDINPQDNDSEMGSQSISGTQRYATPAYMTAAYTLFSKAPGSSAPRASQGRSQLPGIEDDGSDDESEKSEFEDDASQDLVEAELKENALDSLWHESEALARLLRNPKPGSKSWHRLLPVFRGNWFRIREFFVETDALFIDLLTSIEDISERQQMKARAVIIGANATSLLNVISDAELRKEDNFDRVWKIFERLDEDFPAPLCPYDDYADHVTEDDIELALDIRTQRLITSLKALQDDQQNPADIAAELFCVPLESSIDAEEALQYGPFRGINGRMAERFAERAKQIYDAIVDKNVDDAIQVLDEMFPLEGSPDQSQNEADDEPADFIGKISSWCSKMIDELSVILKDPPQGPRESSPTDSLPSSAPQDIVRNDVREDILSRSNVQLLAKLSREHPSRTRPSPSLANSQRGSQRSSQRGATAEPIINGGIGDDYYEEEAEDHRRRNPSPAPSDLSAIIAGLPSTAIIRSRQPSSSSAKAGPSTAAPRSSDFIAVNNSGRKRPRETSLSHSQHSQESDDPFEEDNRDPNPQRRAQLARDRRDMPPPPSKRKTLPSTAPPPPRQPSSSASSSSTTATTTALQRRPRSSLPTSAPASSAPASTSASRSSVSSTATTVASFREINEMNRRPASRAGPQQRVPWSDKDTHRLIRLIEHHNCLWALIAKRQIAAAGNLGGGYGGDSFEEREDCVFDHPRDQQAIRDKARNLKVDLLKADLNLYPGFDGIALGKKERLALIGRGKNPDRREGDVDAAGEPTHTEYVPLESDDEDDEL
ncbi:hypothetical protein CABS01_03359 [Colletotrichum abscissum]|uniref:Myb dna-binding domain protein n=1 Tax=Colletotrichum abscissum TaxID=1671311 RepID=A0A9P9X6N6_9PEZI|nr:uncharacterized protein CABS01_03359 [Colletotrichum abscissum]KAI3538987.1 hypothetical protein CABS02_11578 [Colletotrichum abscissum]KAK1478057.1 hypothetical protein CABS01_03359 [Colletotrichum abscissum]